MREEIEEIFASLVVFDRADIAPGRGLHVELPSDAESSFARWRSAQPPGLLKAMDRERGRRWRARNVAKGLNCDGKPLKARKPAMPKDEARARSVARQRRVREARIAAGLTSKGKPRKGGES